MADLDDVHDVTAAAVAPTTPRDVCARLTQAGWRVGLTITVATLVLSFVLAGYFVIYWRNADMDFMVVYSALAANAGEPMAFYDHPAYITILSLRWWFALLHHLGLLDAWSLSDIPSALNVAAFDTAMTHVIRAGRLLSFLIALGFVLVFEALVRWLTRDWRLSLLAAFAFAFSGGFMLQMRIMRSEMIAACLVILPLVALMAVARRASAWRPLVLGAAAACCMVALENKVHAILLIAALPALVLPFGTSDGASVALWRSGGSRWWLALVAALAAAGFIWLALPLIAAGLHPVFTAGGPFRPLLFGTFGVYQAALLLWIGACMVAFARIWHVSPAERVAAMCLVLGGAALGLLVLDLQFDHSDVEIVLNPLEKMLTIAGMLAGPGSDPASAGGAGLAAAPVLLLHGIVSVLARYTFVLHTSPRPTVFLTWLIFPGIVLAWRRGERQAALQAALLMLAAIGIDALGVQRNLKVEYFTFTDPLIILAGVVLLERLHDLRFHRLAYPIAVTLYVLHIGISQAEPIRHITKHEGAAESICDWNQAYLPLLPLPWCDKPPKQP